MSDRSSPFSAHRAAPPRRPGAPRVLAALAGFLALASCATYKPVDPAFHEALNQPYQLDAGDQVRVTVFAQADLTNTYAVDKGGYLNMPLVGAVQARGRTAKQIEGDIAAKLGVSFVKDPDVAVEIDRYRPFFVMGEVSAAGQYSYVPGMTVQNAVAIAGGFSPRARQDDADVTRQVNGEVLTGRVELSDPLLPGDTVYIRERLF